MVAQVRFRDTAGLLRTLVRCRVRDATGTLRTIQRIRIRDAAGILRTVYQSMTAVASPSITQSFTATTVTLVTTGTSGATPTGGTAPYTYLWSPAAYNTDSISASTPTGASTTFRRTSTVSGGAYLGDFTCTITDAVGVTATSNIITIALDRA